MPKIFHRKPINYGTTFNFFILFLLLCGICLIMGNLNDAISVYEFGDRSAKISGYIFGPREFKSSPNAFWIWFYLGCFLIVLSLVLRLKFKVKNSVFIYIFLVFIVSLIPYYFGISGVLNAAISLSCVFLIFRKKLSHRKLQFFGGFALFNIFIFIAILVITGSVHNHAHYVNHNRLIGNHPIFSSEPETCYQKYDVYFKYNFIPVKEPCYFKRYLDEGEELTYTKTKLLSIYYGSFTSYSNFLISNHEQRIIKNYSEKEAVLLYQIAYEAFLKRLELTDNKKFKKGFGEAISRTSQENYQKSLELSPEQFIEHLKIKNEDTQYDSFSKHILQSLDNENKTSPQRQENDFVTYEDLLSYKNKIYNGNKSTLFSDNAQKKYVSHIQWNSFIDAAISGALTPAKTDAELSNIKAME